VWRLGAGKGARFSFSFSAVFVLAGCVWMAASAYFLQRFIDDPEMVARLRLASAGALIIVSTAILHVFETSRSNIQSVVDAGRSESYQRRSWLQLGALFLTVPILLFVVAVVQVNWIERSVFGELTVIANYKSRQIRHWIDEREADVQSLVRDSGLIADIIALEDSGDIHAGKKLAQRLEAFRSAHSYLAIVVFRPDHQAIIEIGDQHIEPRLSVSRIGERSLGKVTVEANWQRMCISYPIFLSEQGDQLFGFIHVEMDASAFLGRFLADKLKRTGESLLVSASDNEVQFLSPLRFDDERQPAEELSMEAPALPAAIALREGGAGVVSGWDYRGEAVLAAYSPVPGTDWQLISKIDRREALEPLYSLLSWVGLVALAGVAVVGAMWLRLQRLTEAISQGKRDALLNQFYDLPFVGIAVTSPKTKKMLRFNGRLCEILGYSEEELKACTWAEITHPDDLQKDVDEFNRVVAGESEGYQIDKRYLRRDGSTVEVSLDVKPLRNSNGEIEYFIAMIQDITERRAAEARIAASEARLRTLVNTIPDLIWLKDGEGRYLTCNPAFENFFGASEAQIVGKTDFDFVDREQAEFFRRHDLKAAKAGKPSVNEETLSFAKGDYTGVFETIKAPMMEPDGKIIGILGIARDITQRKEDTAKIERLQSLYSVLSLTNQAIVRCDEEEQLFSEICQNAVEHGGFVMAWVGMLDSASGKVNPVASRGDRSGYLDNIDISIDPMAPSGVGPSGTSIRENRPVWCQDFQHSSSTNNWQNIAQQAGVKASAALPLTRYGEVVGNLNVYSDRLDAFDEEAKTLLVEISADISFALEIIASDRLRHQAEERLRLIIEGGRDAPWDWNLETGEAWYSPRLWQLNGYDPEQGFPTDAETWRRFVHPDDIAKVEGVITRLLNSDDRWATVECRGHHLDGHFFPTLIRAIATRNDDGKLIRLTGTVMDLSEQKQVEEELREQRNELSHAKWLLDAHLENSPLAVVEWNSELRIVHWSGGAERIFGWPESEVKGKRPDEFPFIVEDDMELREEIVEQLTNSVSPTIQKVVRHNTRSGDTRCVAWYLSALHDEAGKLISVLSLAEDITEKIAAETSLRKREHLLDQIFTILPVGVWLSDKDGNLLRANPTIQEIWGDTRLVGPADYGVFHARRMPSGEEVKAEEWAILRALHEGEVVTGEMLEIDTFDGKSKTILNYVAPVLDDQGKVDGAVVVNLDVTERARNQQRMAQQLDELNRWYKATVGREERVIQLKQEVNSLMRQLNLPERYLSAGTPASDKAEKVGN
jgi:PAS domain S-box-containing protein